MKKLIVGISLLMMIWIVSAVNAVSVTDYAVFSQINKNKRTFYIAKSDGSELHTVAYGDNIFYFLEKNHLFYFTDHQLYEYDLTSWSSRLLAKFIEDRILLQMWSTEPDQALIVASNYETTQWYILDLPDGGIRRINRPTNLESAPSASERKSYSPDGLKLGVIKTASFGNRYDLVIQTKSKKAFKTCWTLPKDLTVLNDLPVWSPDSQLAAFYGKEVGSTEGFYSLYLFNLESKSLIQVQKLVFSKLAFENLQMGPFIPEWSGDSKNLIFQYRPYGAPTESSIIKYDVSSGKKITLTYSPGNNQYPQWSPSGKRILFLSNRETEENQLYSMNDQGENICRLSPLEGSTEWAVWFQF